VTFFLPVVYHIQCFTKNMGLYLDYSSSTKDLKIMLQLPYQDQIIVCV